MSTTGLSDREKLMRKKSNKKRHIMIECGPEKEDKIIGAREDNRSNFIILAMEQNHFKVVKCGDSYNFKTYKDLQKFSIEDVEKLIKTPRVRGSRGGKTGDEEDGDEEKIPETKEKKGKKDEKGEDMDFEEKFDDDQEEEKGTSFFEQKELTESGKHLKNILDEYTKGEGENDEDDLDVDENEEQLNKKFSGKSGEKPKPTKRRREGDDEEEQNVKRQRTIPAAGSTNSDVELETEIRSYLEVRGRVPLPDLLKKFKQKIQTEEIKLQFRGIIKNLCDTFKDEGGNTLLKLKDGLLKY